MEDEWAEKIIDNDWIFSMGMGVRSGDIPHADFETLRIDLTFPKGCSSKVEIFNCFSRNGHVYQNATERF